MIRRPKITFARNTCGMQGHVILASIIFFIAWVVSGCSEQKHPSGKDTIRSFRDGRFQVADVAGSVCLVDLDTSEVILEDLTNWKRKGSLIFAVAQGGESALVDLTGGNYETYSTAEAVPKDHMEIFEKLRE